MYSDTLVAHFRLTRFHFRKTHTSGSVVLFENPCIGYILRGRARFLYQGKNYYAGEGDLIYIAKGTRYYSVWTGEPDIDFYSVDLAFVKPYSHYEYRFQLLKDYPRTEFDEMYRFYREDGYRSVASLYRILSDIFRRMNKENAPRPGKGNVRPAVEYIESHYNQTITIGTLAALCHCCVSGFFRSFRVATGVTPIAYKHNIMIQNALDLLTHTDLSVEEVSDRVGFSSSHYFRKVFSDITGKTPREVRQRS